MRPPEMSVLKTLALNKPANVSSLSYKKNECWFKDSKFYTWTQWNMDPKWSDYKVKNTHTLEIDNTVLKFIFLKKTK